MAARRASQTGGASAMALLEEAFTGPAWHGPSLREALRGVTPAEASWRPAPGRNTIWELLLHVAYTKHVVLRRLVGRTDRFARPLPRAWWPATPDPADEAAWGRDRALLDASHRALTEAVRSASAATLARGDKRPLIEQLVGAALHDTYHGGQIRLLRKLYQSKR